MADAGLNEDLGDDVEAQPKKGGLSGKKLILFIVLPLLLIGGGGAGAYFSGALDSLLGAEETVEAAEGEEGEEADGEPDGPVTVLFYDLPDMLVNLNTTGRKASFLKLSVSLEVGSEADRAALEQLQPRIVDNFQVYLRELRIEDLRGSAGLQRLREELLLRVNAATYPTEIRDVLFKQMLVQ
ncbi:flagellar basal body-associated FliL family protein [Rhodovibrionaceae bacterium A322]